MPATAEKTMPKVEPTIGGSVYVKPSAIEWEPTQFEGISIKVLYEDKQKGEMTCLLKWDPGATLPMHKHPAIEQSWVIEGSFYDHDGICRAGEFVWRQSGSFHETHSDEGRDPRDLSQTECFPAQRRLHSQGRAIAAREAIMLAAAIPLLMHCRAPI